MIIQNEKDRSNVMKTISKEVLHLLDEDLMGFIINDTRQLVINTKKHLIDKKDELFDKIEKTWEIVQNVLELDFMYSNHINTKPKYYYEAMGLAGELYVLQKAVVEVYNSNKNDASVKPKIIDELEDFMLSLIDDKKVKRKYYFTADDIKVYKNKMHIETKDKNDT